MVVLYLHNDTPHEGDGSDDGRQRNGVLLFCPHMNGAEVDGFLCGGVDEAVTGEESKAEKDEENAQDGRCIHETTVPLKNAAALNEAQEDHDDGDHEQDVNEAADGVAGHETEEPEDDEDDGEGVKHEICTFLAGKLKGILRGRDGV